MRERNGTDYDPHLAAAELELRRAGLYDADADYGAGSIAECVLDLLEVLYRQRHSGGSHGLVMEIFNRLAEQKRLTPLTNDPDEWMNITEYNDGKGLWQNRRQGSCFSLDGGKTYYDIDEKRSWWRKKLRLGHHGFTLLRSAPREGSMLSGVA